MDFDWKRWWFRIIGIAMSIHDISLKIVTKVVYVQVTGFFFHFFTPTKKSFLTSHRIVQLHEAPSNAHIERFNWNYANEILDAKWERNGKNTAGCYHFEYATKKAQPRRKSIFRRKKAYSVW